MREAHKQVLHAMREAPLEHRIVTLLVAAVAWYVLENVLQYHNAAKGVEVFGVAPFADRALQWMLGEV